MNGKNKGNNSLPSNRLGDILVKERAISANQRDISIRASEAWGSTFKEVLFQQGYITEDGIVASLSRWYGVPKVDLWKIKKDPKAARIIPKMFAKKYCMFVVAREFSRIYIAMADPTNIFALDDTRFLSQFEKVPMVSSEKDILQTIEDFYGPD